MSESSDDDYYGPPLPPELRDSTQGLGESLLGKNSISCKRPALDARSSSTSKSGKYAVNSESEEETKEDDFIGPALPPGFRQSPSLDSEKDSEDNTYGPSPPTTHTPQKDVIEMDSMEVYGPALPPNFQKSKPANTSLEEFRTSIGPLLPPGYSESHSDDREVRLGPSLPPGFPQQEGDSSDFKTQEEKEAVIGPLPLLSASKPDELSSVAKEIEQRAKQMKDKLTKKESAKSDTVVPLREAWMTELPPEIGKNFGLTSRSFRTNAAPINEDRSVWTDTPVDRVRKEKESSSGKKRKLDQQKYNTSGKDKKLAQEINEYNKSKRPVSLLEMHQKELNRKKKKEKDKPKERRPFDRESDLQVHRFDEAQRKALIKRSQDLHTRFDHGHTQSQFL
ncbi:hypothetical protein CHS0354_023338 [Potamilus streckersoni]|uniref:DUF3752 domain-containing protein n=1 Tax=Potamilus streckersoni TaxID=2493646 RepID=A0AAE0T4L6_9BIVA|nr:hypothetical protein CHS0354_023338 [Potamilus streckersoni]